MNQFNLLENNDQNNSNTFGIKVDDQDLKLPEDLQKDTDESTYSFLDKYRNWLIVLAGTILIFIAVVYSISSSSTEIQERLEATESEIEANNVPSFFMGSLANLPSNTNTTEEENEFDSFLGEFEQFEDSFDDDIFNVETITTTNITTVEENDDNFFNEDFFGSAENQVSNIDNSPTQTNTDSLEELFGMIESTTTSNENLFGSFEEGPSLNSNTAAETLMSNQMQGDTGPALWLSIIPSVLYGISRKRRRA